MKIALGILLALTASGAAAQVTCQQVGQTTICSDGTTYNRVGNTIFGSDGSSAQRVGNSTFINPPPQPIFTPPAPIYPSFPAPQVQRLAPGMLRPQQCGYNSLGRYICQ